MEKELKNLSKSELIPLLLASRKELEEQTWRQQAEIKQLELLLQQINTEKEKLAQLSNQQVDLISYLESQIAYFSRLLYGQKRERFEDPNQLKLPFMEDEEQTKVEEEATVEKIKITYERQKQKEAHPGRHPLPNHLRVEEEIIEPEQDTTDMVKIGEEVSDKLELKPAEFYIRRIIRPKYAKKGQENNGVVIAPLPERAFGKMIAGNSLLASILVDKYVDHLPLYRQLQRFKRENIPISSNTLDGWVKQVGEFIQILYEHLKKQILLRGYLQVDETTIKVLDPSKKGKTHLGYYWVCHDPISGAVIFEYHPGRGGDSANKLLEGFTKGYIQTDGYEVYKGIAKRNKDIVQLCCWAHARREFDKALDNDKEKATMALSFIQGLYKVEREAKEAGMKAAERKALRLTKSLPTLEAFGKWLLEAYQTGKVLPQSRIGKAMAYAISRWKELNAYLLDGHLEIDNNLIENAIRPVALGRKNYLFAGSHEGAQRAAAFYSFFAMCKKEEVNPRQWLEYVLDNLNEVSIQKLDGLLPKNFKKLKM